MKDDYTESDDPAPDWRWWHVPAIAWQGLLDFLTWASGGFERLLRGGWRSGDETTGLDGGAALADNPAAEPATGWFRSFADGLGRLLEWSRLGPVLAVLGRWLLWLLRPIIAVAGFCYVLFSTRRRELLWWSLPLAVVLTPVGLFLIQSFAERPTRITENYRRALLNAIENRDFDQAWLFQQKLEQMGSPSQQLGLAAADDLAAQGNYEQAYQMLERMAPRDMPGFVPAHLWIAEHLLGAPGNRTVAEALELSLIHLGHARTALGKSLPAMDFLEAIVLVRQNRLEPACRILDSLRDQSLGAAALKLEIDLALQDQQSSLADARSFLKLVAAEKDASSYTDPRFFRLWLGAEQVAGSPDGALAVADRWLNALPRDEAARLAWLKLASEELDETIRGSAAVHPEVTGKRVQAIARRLGSAERSSISSRVEQFHRQRNSRPGVEAMFQWLENDPGSPAMILEYLGTLAIIANQPDRARQLLERATAADPSDHVSWNNLAYLLNLAYPAEKQAALAAATRALELSPANGNVLETRGVILLQLGRWKDAIRDLELALPMMKDPRQIHQALALAYRESGDPVRAEQHSRQSLLNAPNETGSPR